MMGNMDSLPKWAQQRMANLERDLADALSSNEQLRGAGPLTPMCFATRRLMGPTVPLPAILDVSAVVSLREDGEPRGSIGFNWERGEQALHINGSDRLQIEPRATNSFYVRMVRLP